MGGQKFLLLKIMISIQENCPNNKIIIPMHLHSFQNNNKNR